MFNAFIGAHEHEIVLERNVLQEDLQYGLNATLSNIQHIPSFSFAEIFFQLCLIFLGVRKSQKYCFACNFSSLCDAK